MASNNESQPRPQEQQQEEPGLVSSHIEFARGVLESAFGDVADSHAWKSSGEQDKAHAVAAMKAAGEQRDPKTQGYGKWEESLGKATGCEGMQKEGAASADKHA